MFGRRQYLVEQPTSLAHRLETQGVRHGDVAKRVELTGVGYHRLGGFLTTRLSLAFCPAQIISVGEVIKASSKERRQPFPDIAYWTPDAITTLTKTPFSERGFARIICDITSNGAIHLSNLRVVQLEAAPAGTMVNRYGMYEQFLINQA